MRKKNIKNCFKSIKWFSHKRRWFIVKHVVIICILALLFYFLLVNHLVAENNVFSIIANFSLNYSFILIPALLYLIEVRRSFKTKFYNIFSLKNSLIYLRSYIAREITGLKNEEHRDIIIDPSNINQIIGLLRNFKFQKHASLFLSHIERKRLYHLDLIIIDVIKKIKKYDSGKDFKTIKQNWDFKNAKETIERLEKISDLTKLKEHFLKDLTFPLAFSFLFDNSSQPLSRYYYVIDKYQNETYQKIINAVLDILRYNVQSEGKETQEFNVNIVKAIEVLIRNRQDLLDLGLQFNSNQKENEYTLIILNEPCDLLVIKIKMDNTFKVNTRYDTKLEEAKNWVKENMIAHLQRNIKKFNLELKDEEFWIK